MPGKEHMEAIRILAGAVLELLPVPDGELRETLLNVANPKRPDVLKIIKRSDAEDERAALRRHFKALNTGYVNDEATRRLIECTVDSSDPTTFTAQHDHTDGALRELLDQFDDGDEDDGPDESEDRNTLVPEDSFYDPDNDYDPVKTRGLVDPAEYEAFRAWKASQTNETTENTEDTP
jgi:hypothetical protein